MSTIRDNKRRGLEIESVVKAYFRIQTLNPASNIVKVESHQHPNDPYDFIIYQNKSGKTYKKYVEVKSGNSQLTPLEEEFKKNHPHSYKIVPIPSNSKLYNFMEEWRSITSTKDWIDFLRC